MMFFPSFYYRLAIKETFDVEIAFKNDESTKIIASSRNKKSKKIQWIHTDMTIHSGWKRYFRSEKERNWYLRRYDTIIGVSEHTVRSIRESLGCDCKTMTVHNFITDEVLTLSEEPVELEFSNNYPVIACVGRLEAEKRVDMVIRMHKKLIDQGYHHNLLIVGTGTQQEELMKMVHSMKIRETVSFVGFQKNPYKYMKKCAFLVCTSLYEGFHLVSVEAMALGKPVISCCPVFEEIMGDVNCGIYCSSSEDDIQEKVRYLLMNNEEVEKMGERAKKRAHFFEGDNSIRQLNRILDCKES